MKKKPHWRQPSRAIEKPFTDIIADLKGEEQMTFTDLMLSNYKTEIRIHRLNHQGDENIILKFETEHGLSSIFLSEEQAMDLLIKVRDFLCEDLL